MFSELDNALLPWLPYIISMLLGVWLITGAREAKENPQWDIEEDRAVGEQSQHLLEAPKPTPTKGIKKSGVAALIASEYQKHSK